MTKNTLFLLSVLSFFVLAACSDTPSHIFQGYVEGEYILVASPIGGTLDELYVNQGQTLSKNTPLFTLEREYEKAAVDAARHGLQRAQNNLANLEKGLRPSEIASLKARLNQAIASEGLAKIEYKRRVKLIEKKTISQEELDRSKSDYDQKKQRVKEIQAELTTARLGARSDEIRAATAEMMQSQSKLDQALWNYDQKSRIAPSDAFVFDTLFRSGEWIASGQPVVSLLPPENIEIRFFVPQTIVGKIQRGEEALVTYDGVKAPVKVTITYISPSAEFTPPVIYSSQSRAKLVFMLKAKPSRNDAAKLHPGQPVDVSFPALAL